MIVFDFKAIKHRMERRQPTVPAAFTPAFPNHMAPLTGDPPHVAPDEDGA